MINKLTKDQEKLLQKQFEDGLKFGRSVEPINHVAAERIINNFYQRIGLFIF